jgi:hypothetical protein
MIPPKDMDRILSFGSKAKKRAQRRRADPGHDRLPPEASITLAAEREATGIDSILAALEDDLIGLAPIKQKVNEIASLLLVDRARRRFGLDAPRCTQCCGWRSSAAVHPACGCCCRRCAGCGISRWAACRPPEAGRLMQTA